VVASNDFRQSQGVVPFGVGAIVDFPDESLMAAGLDVWPVETCEPEQRQSLMQAHEILDGRLQRQLSIVSGTRIERFLAPLRAPEAGGFRALHGAPQRTAFMPFVRFPTWLFCPRCRLMWRTKWNTKTGDKSLRCKGTIRRREGEGQTCGQLRERGRPRPLCANVAETLTPFVITVEGAGS